MVTESIDALDVSLFDRIPSQTTSDDRRALLAVQSCVARHFEQYCYLEIGSHLGGSIQPHLLDPRCRRIYSIDPRPPSQQDDRGGLYHYPDNSTERMLDRLGTVAADELDKLQTFEIDARELDPGRLDDPPHLCFIDGEHTTGAVLGDFEFCRRVCHPDGTICFHDANVVWAAVWRIARRLRRQRVDYSIVVLPGSVVAIALGGSPVRRDATVRSIKRSPTRAVLTAALHDVYRRGRSATLLTTPYTEAYYAGCTDISGRSARRVVPHVMQLLAPASVIDVGCGMGTWLKAFADTGVGTILGVDGDHVTPTHMQIEPGHFVARDLARSLDLPGDVPQRFDLAVSLEVAEHLPPKRAAGFVADLTAVAPAVLFSAAIPHQGGAGHVNEQWPEYWAALFAERGFRTVDCIRRLVWDDPDVAYYYAQNMFLFVEPAVLERHTHLQPFVVEAGDSSLSRIHPRRWLEVNDPRRRSIKETLRGLPWALRNALTSRANGH